MDYDDRYHPSNQNDLVNAIDEIKKFDSGYNVIMRKAVSKDGIFKNKKVVVYNSGGTGSRIRDAVTGSYSTDLVGSANEHLYFSVILPGESSKGSLTLFFETPEQCETHTHQTISASIKQRWNEKRLIRTV